VSVASKAAGETANKGIDRGVMAVFAGLMLGSLVASLNLTLVAPALPTIVAELGGIADYTWIPISAMIASTIVVPIAGKLSDVYGRKPLYMTAWESSCRSRKPSSATSLLPANGASTRG
jgi:MFS family permease